MLTCFIIAQLSFVTSASVLAILNTQCWHENPFSTVVFQTSSDGRREIVSTSSINHVALNLKSIADHHAPWSYPPSCTKVLQGISDKLCVYTNTRFSHGRGISIFTTPSIAEQFASLPVFQDPSTLDDQDINTFSGAWRVSSIPNKGIGMLAAKPLTFKDRVTAYTPTFLAYFDTELSTQERETWWRLAIEQLPEKTRNKVSELAKVYNDERVWAQDIVKANSFSIQIGGIQHLAIFPETSRLNHACAPNAQYIIDADLLTHSVHVTRPIAEGEEITISYITPFESTAKRQDLLQQAFHFTCTCPRCTSTTSDATLDKIHSLQTQLNDWSPSSPGSPELAEKLLQLHREEGLEGFLDIAYGFAALAYNAVGNVGEAVRNARLAKEAVLLKDGAWAPNLRIWDELLADPQGHWSFRRRVR